MRHGITIVNSPGTVDAGYRGEIRVTLLNTDAEQSFAIAVGDRIAQLIVMPVSRARFVPVQTLPGSHRGERRFRLDRRPAPTRRSHVVSDTIEPRQHGRSEAAEVGSGGSRDRRSARRERGQRGAPLRRPRRRQDPAAPRAAPAARGRGGQQARRRRRPRLRRFDPAGAALRGTALERAVARDPPADRRPDPQAGRHDAHRATGSFGPEVLAEIPVRQAPAPGQRGSSASTARAGSCAASSPERVRRTPRPPRRSRTCSARIVVVRGTTPMPPRDLIPLHMPAAGPPGASSMSARAAAQPA